MVFYTYIREFHVRKYPQRSETDSFVSLAQCDKLSFWLTFSGATLTFVRAICAPEPNCSFLFPLQNIHWHTKTARQQQVSPDTREWGTSKTLTNDDEQMECSDEKKRINFKIRNSVESYCRKACNDWLRKSRNLTRRLKSVHVQIRHDSEFSMSLPSLKPLSWIKNETPFTQCGVATSWVIFSSR